MSKNYNKYIGLKFNKLYILGVSEKVSDKNNPMATCRCECGNVTDLIFSKVIRGLIKSCGCNIIRYEYENVIFRTNEGYDVRVIEYIDKNKVRVKFLDEHGHETIKSAKNIREGKLRNPFHKTAFGVGYLGDDICTFKPKLKSKAYILWRNMLERCYDESKHDFRPTYKNVTVCEEWHNYKNFSNWYDDNYPKHIEDIKFDLDKDLLQHGIKNKIYSPDTCVFLPREINTFIINKDKEVGVREIKNGVWEAKILLNGKKYIIGLFDNEEQARCEYKKYRNLKAETIKEQIRKLNIFKEDIINLIS